MNKLVGITLISNGVKFGYPFIECIKNMQQCCNQVLVNVDTHSSDETIDKLYSLLVRTPYNLSIYYSKWDWSINKGTDLANQANLLLDKAIELGYNTVLYLQADEVINPNDIKSLQSQGYLEKYNIALERTYFWKDLYHINKSWTLKIPRIAQLSPKLRVVEDGMSMLVDHSLGAYIELPPSICRIYHYSRIGDTKKIAARLNNLDSLFHAPNEYQPIKDYVFGINNNFEQNVDTAEIIEYSGKHPQGIEEFYE